MFHRALAVAEGAGAQYATIVMATHSLVGPGLHSQAGEAAPKCVSLSEWASGGKAAQETE